MRILTEQILVLRKQVRILTQDPPMPTIHIYLENPDPRPTTGHPRLSFNSRRVVWGWGLKRLKRTPVKKLPEPPSGFSHSPRAMNIEHSNHWYFSGRITEHAAQLRMNNILLQNQIDSINTPPKSWKTVGDDKNQSDKETKSAFMSLHCNWAGLLKGRLQKFYTPEDRGRGALPIWKWPTFGQNKPKTGPNLAAE